MKKIETFEGTVNGVRFTSKEAMDNYVANLNEPITEYSVSTSFKYADEETNDSNPPAPYIDDVSYIIPTVDEINKTEEIVKEDAGAIDRINKNLNDRLEYYVNHIEGDSKDSCKHDAISMAAENIEQVCLRRVEAARKRVNDIQDIINNYNRILEERERVFQFYDNLGGYVSALKDIIAEN